MKITAVQTGTIDTWLHLHARPLKSESGIRISVPVTCYLLEHDGRRILFDAGQLVPLHEQSPMANYFARVTAEETAVRRLEAMNVSGRDIEYIIISHGDGDHCNGLRDFPQNKVIVQTQAAESLKRFGNELVVIDGQYDVWGDGRVLCIPTPGHSPGHQSLLVTRDDGSKILLVGDVVYIPEAMSYEPAVDEYGERKDYFDSIALLRTMRDNGVELCFGHYPYTLVN